MIRWRLLPSVETKKAIFDEPFAAEVFCAETGGLANAEWRFARNRALWVALSLDTGSWQFLATDASTCFTLTWDGTTGYGGGR
jgi:hypothetical protein